MVEHGMAYMLERPQTRVIYRCLEVTLADHAL
jgi:hypothetical protein